MCSAAAGQARAQRYLMIPCVVGKQNRMGKTRNNHLLHSFGSSRNGWPVKPNECERPNDPKNEIRWNGAPNEIYELLLLRL